MDHRLWLSAQLTERKRRNPAFSLRSFAKKMGISPTTLSLVMAGRRRLTPRLADRIAARLALSPAERASFLGAEGETDEYLTLEQDTFKSVSSCYHFAILSLAQVPGARSSPKWIAARLGISSREAAEAYGRLKRLGIVEDMPRGRFRQVSPPLATSDDLADTAIRAHVAEHLKLAERALDAHPSAEMDYSSITMAIDPAALPRAKEEIKRFRRRLGRLLEDNRKSRVYTMSIQLYPVDNGGVH